MTTSPRESYPHTPDSSATHRRPGGVGSPYNKDGFYTTKALEDAVTQPSNTTSGYFTELLSAVSAHNPDHVAEPTLGN